VLVASAEVFTTGHIAVTAAISGLVAFVGALLLLGGRRGAWVESGTVAVLTAAAVFLWRKSANMPQLNTDGLRAFSANDWLAPTVTLAFLIVYKKIRQPGNNRGFDHAVAFATVAALIVNVVTI
jgi:hypothetical protein